MYWTFKICLTAIAVGTYFFYLVLDHNDGQFFRAMEWLMFFLGHHCRQWFFNGFDKVGPSPLNVFWGVQPLEPMVFRWFSKF